jgi:tRNA modification GTPase
VRESASGLEQRGIELARRRRGRADAVVLVVDAELGFGESERALWDELASVPRVIAWNKRDLGGMARRLPEGAAVIETVATGGEGVPSLRAALKTALGESGDEGGLRVSARHREALLDGAAALARASEVLSRGEPPELAAVEAREALHHLGRITGETVDAEVLDAIFARFCIGK